ncbi:hypothetical protein D9613_008373 [Agrocybe pediades]|uniref:DUF6533 domain-containing protein n=1 Tax=Agrocybe pediades TaxID=84607 RepID=A0A8H4VNQ3_9AGAR|nr:hypothetical protein D9613_008373 [Agrocybe pediades]
MEEDVTPDMLRSMSVNYNFSLISYTILVLEYLATFEEEVERFWKAGRINWASGFFYVNRYLTLFGHIPVLVEYFWRTSNPDKRESFHQYLAMLIQAIIASMLIMRMYALYERSKKVLALHLTIAIVAVSVGCWAVIGGKKQDNPDVKVAAGCGISLTHYQAVRLGVAWSGMLVFDFVVFGLTLYKSLTIPRTRGVDLLDILLRDGAIYFSVMIASNLGNILTFVFGGPFTRGVATTFMNIVSSVMISRLMLNLRNPTLVTHSQRDSFVPTMTYPNLTFAEPEVYVCHSQDTESTFPVDEDGAGGGGGGFDESGSNGDGEREGRGGRQGNARKMYEYLARGSVKRSLGDAETRTTYDIELADREYR